MKCFECGSRMKTARENFRYGSSGLPVTLVGVDVSRCAACGEFEVAIPRIEELHRAIAMEVIRKRARLTAKEVRYLRKYLGWLSTEFARHMGVSVGAVSRWENGRDKMGAVADRLLRLMVAHGPPDSDYSLDELTEIVEKDAAPLKLGMRVDREGWQKAA